MQRQTLAAGISNAGKFITNTMNGKLFFSLKNAALINLKSFQNIQQYVFKEPQSKQCAICRIEKHI